MASQDRLPEANRLVIRGVSEPRYWTEVERGPRSGEWVSAGQPGPSVSVAVTPVGLEIYAVGNVKVELRPGQARWLACRILEALGVYETVFSGDGTTSRTRNDRPPLAAAPSPPLTTEDADGVRTHYCPYCPKCSTNRGAMASHIRNCKHRPEGVR